MITTFALAAFAQEAPADMPGSGTHALTKTDAEAWLDGLLPYALQAGDIAGAVVVVVKDGAVLLQKGYGYSDVAARKTVDPERTLFRPGSVSKLFTWTAVMQLVEEGKLDLDADINTYLDFKIPPRQGKPITLRNAMTHTTGFNEVGGLLLIYDPRELHPLGEELKRLIPPRVTAPGIIPAYCNYGASLAGYIVERVSGESFESYIERHIFDPLGMTHATFRQPLPQALAPWMSKGYPVASGDPKPFEIDTTPPDGALSISGADMGRFMIAHLQNGVLGSSKILEETSAVQMHSTARNFTPPLNGILLGFFESNINGHRVIAHGGDLQWFHSDVNLFVDDGVGLFISLNSLGKDGAAGPIMTAVFRQFSDRYFPGPLPEGSVDAETAKKHAELVSGRYVSSRRSHESFFALLNLLGQVRVSATDNGSVSLPDFKGLDGEPKKWREIAPFVWRNVEGSDRIAARIENNRVAFIGYDELPFMPFQPWWWSAVWLLPLLVIVVVALTANTLAWSVSALVRRYYGADYGLVGREARTHLLVRIVSLLVMATVIAWVILIQVMSGDLGWIGPHLGVWISSLRLLSLVILFGSSAIALWNVWNLLHSQRKWLARAWGMALAISCLALLYIAIVFHMVGYSANY
ncbi:MAG: beta-lactamase family protein [Chthoniobacterales bacterium]|nr:beta-lactamase family protein [Chthoniobacterales bacterium]